jgi:hypothetical protein
MHDESRPLVTSGARRGCGYRQPGGAYFAVPVAPGGRPVEEFLIDPPVVIEDAAARYGLTSVGVGVWERDGVTHVVDIVGHEHYPTVASFVDEARRLGVSRRAPRTLDFSQITSQSCLLLAHAHADVANAADFATDAACPCHIEEHLAPEFAGMCVRLWWQEPLQGAHHRLALFASFPIPQIEVVTDPPGGTHVETVRLASQAGVPGIEVKR